MAKQYSQSYFLSGRITDTNGEPLEGLRVLAFDQDPETPENSLGEAITDAKGFYSISFTEKDFKLGGKESGGPDVFIRVLEEDAVLAESEVQRNSGKNIRIDLTVTRARSGYSVSGTVYNKWDEPVSGLTVILYDVDLRGVDTYLDAGIETGRQKLGSADTDNNGVYSITFKESDFASGEASPALPDVAAIIWGEDGKALASSELRNGRVAFGNSRELTGLDIHIESESVRGPSEFRRLLAALEKPLDGFPIHALSEGQIGFLAEETSLESEKIESLAKAAQTLVALRQLVKPEVKEWHIVGARNRAVLLHEADIVELLYGLHRASVALELPQLANNHNLDETLAESIRENVVTAYSAGALAALETAINGLCTRFILEVDESPGSVATRRSLDIAFSDDARLKAAYLSASLLHQGDQRDFFDRVLPELPEFKGRPEALESIRAVNIFSALTLQNLPLVAAFIQERHFRSDRDLVRQLDRAEWQELVRQKGLPFDLEGKEEEEKERLTQQYIDSVLTPLENFHAGAYIARELNRGRLALSDRAISEGVQTFLDRAPDFDLRASKVFHFDDFFEKVAEENDRMAVKESVKTFQRLALISPTMESAVKLHDLGYTSAFQIGGLPEQQFVREYSGRLGSETIARRIHQQAAFSRFVNDALLAEVSAQVQMPVFVPPSETITMPAHVMSDTWLSDIYKVAPNLQNLFGRIDLCACRHCNSVYGPAAYFVDLLHYLEGFSTREDRADAPKNDKGKTPFEMLMARRPDLQHIPLTCENTNTVMPYIDLVNEVLEYYVAHKNLEGGPNDNGQAESAELLADALHFTKEAYRMLAEETVYPFALPYHQPLDLMRRYLSHLGIERRSLVQHFTGKAVKDLSGRTVDPLRALAAEALSMSEAEYKIFTRQTFAPRLSGEPVGDYESAIGLKPLPEHFGYEAGDAGWLKKLSVLPEFLRRTGLTYEETVAIVSTRFVNPDLDRKHEILNDLIKLYPVMTGKKGISIWFQSNTTINIGSFNLAEFLGDFVFPFLFKSPEQAVAEMSFEMAFAIRQELGKEPLEFIQWLQKNRKEIAYTFAIVNEAEGCSLENSSIGVLSVLARNAPQHELLAEAEQSVLTRFLLFVRLWKKWGGSIGELDEILSVLPSSPEHFFFKAFPAEFINELAALKELLSRTGLPLLKILPWWGNIQTAGDKSLYAKLFLNKAIQRIDTIFKPGNDGKYLDESSDALVNSEKIGRHVPVLLAAFQLNEAHLRLVLNDAQIPLEDDALRISNLSLIYRYATLAKALGLKIPDLLRVKRLLSPGLSPFNTPEKSLSFLEAALQLRDSAIPLAQLDYLFNGVNDPEMEPAPEQISALSQNIRKGLDAIQADTAVQPDLQGEVTRRQLSRLYDATVTERVIATLNGTIAPVLFEKRKEWFEETFDFLSNDVLFADMLTDIVPGQSDQAQVAERFELFLNRYLPYLRRHLKIDFLQKTVGETFGTTSEPTQAMLEILDAQASFEKAEMEPEAFGAVYRAFHWAVMVVQQFQIDAPELRFFQAHRSLDNGLPGFGFTFDSSGHSGFKQWMSLLDYRSLVKSMPRRPALRLLDVFTLTEKNWDEAALRKFLFTLHGISPDQVENLIQSGIDETDYLISLITRQTLGDAQNLRQFLPTLSPQALLLAYLSGWDLGTISKALDEEDLNILAQTPSLAFLNGLQQKAALQRRCGAPADKLYEWAMPSVKDFDAWTNLAQEIKRTVKASYEDNAWPEVARSLNDPLRENQKQALIAYLLAPGRLPDWPVLDANDLFGYFLIDVQMDACMETSRLKQAISAAQLFIQRCFLNLEPDVPPHLLDAKIWEWMKHYRVWEANRKVFLYPENWIEPEWRDNKTELFREFESGLLQNELKEEGVCGELENYLHELLKISKLRICSSYLEFNSNTALWKKWAFKKTLHVIGRTESNNLEYFHCCFDYKGGTWAGWKKIPLSINLVEDYKGENEEPIMTLVVRNEILYLFWINFTNKPTIDREPRVSRGEYSYNLYWSKYTNGLWSAASLGIKGGIISDETGYSNPYAIYPYVDETNNINIILKYYGKSFYQFIFNSFEHFEKKELNANLTGSGLYYEYTKISKPTMGHITLCLLGPSGYYNNDVVLKNTDELTDQLLLPFSEHDSNLKILYYPLFFLSHQKTYLIEDLSVYHLSTDKLDFFDKIKPGKFSPIEPKIATWILKFIMFFHPLISNLISSFKLGGKRSLWSALTQQLSDKGSNFESLEPVRQVIIEPYPVENIDLSFEGVSPYSLYNWEIFFHIPLMAAKRFMQNQQFQEAFDWMHCIFDPTTDEKANSFNPAGRYWKLLPFREEVVKSGIEQILLLLSKNDLSPEEAAQKEAVVHQWKALQQDPFKPHLVARKRITAYMKKTVMLYLDTLIAAGDACFRRDTLEDIQTATQYYVMAWSVLGPKPQFIAKRDQREVATYGEIRKKLDAFSNVRREIENLTTADLPHSIGEAGSINANGAVLTAAGGLYFCIPYNDKLLAYWDTIEDRLFKIRHCQNIEGIERKLPLFEPPIDPSLLVQATAQGLSIDAALQDLDAPLPHYRFQLLVQKTLEVCAEVRATGNSLLGVIEKKDSTHLELMRARQEVVMLQDMVTRVKEKEIENTRQQIQVVEAQIQTEFIKYKEMAKRLGEQNTALTDRDLPSLLDAPGGKLFALEIEYLEKTQTAHDRSDTASDYEKTASLLHMRPLITIKTGGTDSGTSYGFGGSNLGSAAEAYAKHLRQLSAKYSQEASKSLTLSGYERRDEQWRFEGEIAAKTLVQLFKQKTALEIQVQIKQWELENHQKQTEFAREIEAFLTHERYANEHFYEWMKGELKTLYRQCYDVAYDLAKKSERAWRFELGQPQSNFIQYYFWDHSHDGFLAGEKLYLGLKQMERAYLDQYRREQEITKQISLLLHDPVALIRLKETGQCEVELPETLFDMDFPGHYMRRIKSVSLTIPCIIGPYTGLNCKLTLLSDKTRTNSGIPNSRYEEDTENEDTRFHRNYIPVQSVAISHGQNDSGLFELNFRDERYLPFEGAGVVSRWRIELPEKFRQFDYGTISDVIFHLRYTAREGGGRLKNAATIHLESMMENTETEIGGSFYRMFSLHHEFPSEWHRLLHTDPGKGLQMALPNLYDRLPYFTRHAGVKSVECTGITLFTDSDFSVSLMPGENLQGIELTNNGSLGQLKQYKEEAVDMNIEIKRDAQQPWILVFDNFEPNNLKDILLILQFRLQIQKGSV